jgi:circadian clock protein KaiC
MTKVAISLLPTGVQGLDTLLNGGISQYSFNVITGMPGSGKTTLAHQIMFSLASENRKALYFTIVGEPPLKMLRYQQQFSYFDTAKINHDICYLNLADDLQKGGFNGVLDRILREVEQFQPGLVFVDSFRSVVNAAKEGSQSMAELQYFVQRLGMHMASWQATTFLIGEYTEALEEGNPIFTVADGVINLTQECDGNAIVRKIRVAKMRGIPHMLGLHTFRMSNDGVRVFPRLLSGGISESGILHPKPPTEQRLSTGSKELDEMLGGGIPSGYSMLLVGPPGAGKTVLTTSFLTAGAKNGERGILATFEHVVSSVMNKALIDLIDKGDVKVVHPKTLDMSIEEIVIELIDAVTRTGATRLVIDSLSALELVLAPQFRINFEESLFRMLSAFANKGVTIIMIRSTDGSAAGRTYRPSGAFLVDGLLTMRLVEVGETVTKKIACDKLRGLPHSATSRAYEIEDDGIRVSRSGG